MGLDLSNDYEKAKSKVSAYQSVVENKKNTVRQKKEKAKTSTDKKKSEVVKQLNELQSGKNEKKNEIKNEIKNQLEQLLDLFKQSLPKDGNQSLSTISKFFLEAAEKTKENIKGILVDEIISTIGCSEEQSYEDKLNQPIYIKVNQIDLFKRLKFSPDDENAKYYYENNTTTPGSIPSSTNRQLYERLLNLGQSYQTQYGTGYVGLSGQDLFDIEYVQFYPSVNPTNFGDFFKVTLKPQLNNATSVSDFLTDYYGSIDVLQFDVLSTEIMNALTGAFDFGLKITEDEMREQKKFDVILKKIMGICTDPTKKIDVGGTAKLSDQDYIDDNFFNVSNQELRTIENSINNTINGVVEFEGCDNIKLPINLSGTKQILDEVISKNGASGKVDRVMESLDELSKDPNWKNKIPSLSLDLNLKGALDTSLITQLPKVVFKTILSPKVMLGFLVMVKTMNNQFANQLDTSFDDLQNFMKVFKKFTVNFMQRVTAIFIRELFSIVKKNIKQLVERILGDIVKEAKNKQLLMYSSIVYSLLVLGNTFVDFRDCKSVIDEILKLLNLSLSNLNTGKEQAENGKTEVYIPPLTVVVPPFGAGPGITKPSKGVGKSY